MEKKYESNDAYKYSMCKTCSEDYLKEVNGSGQGMLVVWGSHGDIEDQHYQLTKKQS